MSIEQFTTELDAKIASMSESELIVALKQAGFEFEDPWLNIFSIEDLELCDSEGLGWLPMAQDSNELALAA